jgi:hypothetical protein
MGPQPSTSTRPTPIPEAKPAAPLPAPAATSGTSPAPASRDRLEPSGKGETWHVQVTTLDEMVEKVKRAQGQETRTSTHHVVEDSIQRNMDTGDVIHLRAEERVEDKVHHTEQELSIQDGKGQLRAHLLNQVDDDGQGHVHGHEVAATYREDGSLESRATSDWLIDHGRKVRDVTTHD